ncbi:MAG: lipase maturation factor family protein, partial [Myxococcota bacterium]
AFCARLLEGRPEVLALLEGNPFPDEPPRFVRVTRYDYRFSDIEQRRATGQWWHRGPGRQVLALSADDLR